MLYKFDITFMLYYKALLWLPTGGYKCILGSKAPLNISGAIQIDITFMLYYKAVLWLPTGGYKCILGSWYLCCLQLWSIYCYIMLMYTIMHHFVSTWTDLDTVKNVDGRLHNSQPERHIEHIRAAMRFRCGKQGLHK